MSSTRRQNYNTLIPIIICGDFYYRTKSRRHRDKCFGQVSFDSYRGLGLIQTNIYTKTIYIQRYREKEAKWYFLVAIVNENVQIPFIIQVNKSKHVRKSKCARGKKAQRCNIYQKLSISLYAPSGDAETNIAAIFSKRDAAAGKTLQIYFQEICKSIHSRERSADVIGHWPCMAQIQHKEIRKMSEKKKGRSG